MTGSSQAAADTKVLLQTHSGRVLLALFVGWLTAWVLSATVFAFRHTIPPEHDRHAFNLLIPFVAYPVGIAGVVLAGAAPTWLVFHRLGMRKAWHAALVGFILGAAGLLAVGLGTGPNVGPVSGAEALRIAEAALENGVVGALSAVLAWRVAYYRPFLRTTDRPFFG